MGRLVKRAGLFGAAIVILGACDTFSGGELSLKNKVVSAEGVRSMVHGKEFVKKGSTEFNEVNVDEIIVDVLGSGKSVKDVSSIKDRNLIQDMLFAASNQRCNLYRRFIQRVGTQTNFPLGALSTLAGGAGAIVTGADTARALAGVSGAASGLRGEFNETYFRSVATQVIVKGIDTRRETLKQQIIEARDADTSSLPAKYTAAMAIADAIAYHGQCTIMAGLEEANDSLASPEDVGMDRFLKSFKNMKSSVKPSKRAKRMRTPIRTTIHRIRTVRRPTSERPAMKAPVVSPVQETGKSLRNRCRRGDECAARTVRVE